MLFTQYRVFRCNEFRYKEFSLYLFSKRMYLSIFPVNTYNTLYGNSIK